MTASLIEASLNGRRVRIVYHGGSTPGVERWVRPTQVFVLNRAGHRYLEAFCEARRGTRCFRLDRLRLIAVDGVGTSQRKSPTVVTRAGCAVLTVALLLTALLVQMCSR